MNLAEQYRRAARLCLVLAVMVAGLATVQSAAKASPRVTAVYDIAITVNAAGEMLAANGPGVTLHKASKAVDVDCLALWQGMGTNRIQLRNSWHCLGNWIEIYNPTDGGCYNLNLFTPAGYPAPNGWSNQASSVVSKTTGNQYAHGYDGFACNVNTNQTWRIGTGEYAPKLEGVDNNTTSSIWFGFRG